jgi:hypothetical protein
MQKLFSVLRLARDKRHIALIFCVGVVLLVSSFADAQSGRRPPKRSESEGVQKSTEPEPSTKPEAKQPEKERTPVMLVKSNSMFGVYYAADYVVEGCAARLKQAATLEIEKHPNDMNRKQASDMAKASTNKYVIFLEMSSDRTGYNRDRVGQEYVEDMVVDYTVFAPGTGKIKTSGRVYQMRPRGNVGGVGLPLPVPNGRATTEYSLKQAGRDVADRVIDSLSVVVPPSRISHADHFATETQRHRVY